MRFVVKGDFTTELNYDDPEDFFATIAEELGVDSSVFAETTLEEFHISIDDKWRMGTIVVFDNFPPDLAIRMAKDLMKTLENARENA